MHMCDWLTGNKYKQISKYNFFLFFARSLLIILSCFCFCCNIISLNAKKRISNGLLIATHIHTYQWNKRGEEERFRSCCCCFYVAINMFIIWCLSSLSLSLSLSLSHSLYRYVFDWFCLIILFSCSTKFFFFRLIFFFD